MTADPSPVGARFERCFQGLAAVGRTGRGGYRRLAWTEADVRARAWFAREAAARGLAVETDGNGNQWAWWGDPTAGGAVATGSHLDTVVDGGAFDGALGVVSGLVAVETLAREGFEPHRPVAVVAFADEEGARFGVPTFGSRLLTGALRPADVLDRPDAAGVRLGDAMAAAGLDPAGLGADPGRLARLAAFVELHVEQGRGLAGTPDAVAVATGIWPHGRWRLSLTGRADHAGTTAMPDRRDPTASLPTAISSAHRHATAGGGVATVGRIEVDPGTTNTIPFRVRAWLDARAPDAGRLDALLARWDADVRGDAAGRGLVTDVVCESRSAAVTFDADLCAVLDTVLGRGERAAPHLATAAGHDAGALAAAVPSAMLFVRNPTGVSHSPREHADRDDCVAGVLALRAVLAELAGPPRA
ncbi:MAG: allantoate amidohydrolase [Actinobacteria bacterium]|nr:allantoate amidohydrolase [Actinomycetota bacterium]